MAKTLNELYPDVINGGDNEEESAVATQILKSLTDTRSKNKQISFRINEHSYEQLKKIAAKKGVPARNIITELINDYLREHQDLLK